MYDFGTFVRKAAWTYSESSILFPWSLYLFLYQYHTVFVTIALKYKLKSGIVIPPELFILLWIALAILGLLCFF
jgi:hypothetical protein